MTFLFYELYYARLYFIKKIWFKSFIECLKLIHAE